MYDHRIVLNLVHRYGEACRREQHEVAGRLYSQIVRAIQDDEESPRPSSEEDERGALDPVALGL
jgi:hypothetical protein